MPKYTIRCEHVIQLSLTIEAPNYEAAHRYYLGPDLDEDLFSGDGMDTFKLIEIEKLPEQNPADAEVEVDARGHSYSS
tara:strand:- start:1281 stop:1514 length:234 start_codon:yes stop_codon:yes gene_type:complete